MKYKFYLWIESKKLKLVLSKKKKKQRNPERIEDYMPE